MSVDLDQEIFYFGVRIVKLQRPPFPSSVADTEPSKNLCLDEIDSLDQVLHIGACTSVTRGRRIDALAGGLICGASQ